MSSVVHLSDTTKKEYTRILNHLGENGIKDDDLDAVKAYFDAKKYGLSTRRTAISAIRNKYKSNTVYDEKLKKYNDEIKEAISKHNVEQKKTDKEEGKYLPWDTILSKSVIAMNDEKYCLSDRILIGLYTQLEPVRNDYVNIRLYSEDPKLDKGTYFIINDTQKQVVINEFKNKSYKGKEKRGAIRQALPEKLSEMIVMWFKDETEMFPVSENTQSARIKKLFQKVTGKPITVCSLRHSRCTFLHRLSCSPIEAKRVAEAMGHSIGTAQQYRYAPE